MYRRKQYFGGTDLPVLGGVVFLFGFVALKAPRDAPSWTGMIAGPTEEIPGHY